MRTRRRIIPGGLAGLATAPFRPGRFLDASVFAVWGDCPEGVTIGFRAGGEDFEVSLTTSSAAMIAGALSVLSEVVPVAPVSRDV